MANQPLYCQACHNYVPGRQWDAHRRECPAMALATVDRVSLVWDSNYLIKGKPTCVYVPESGEPSESKVARHIMREHLTPVSI